jgi:hypothetical protein
MRSFHGSFLISMGASEYSGPYTPGVKKMTTYTPSTLSTALYGIGKGRGSLSPAPPRGGLARARGVASPSGSASGAAESSANILSIGGETASPTTPRPAKVEHLALENTAGSSCACAAGPSDGLMTEAEQNILEGKFLFDTAVNMTDEQFDLDDDDKTMRVKPTSYWYRACQPVWAFRRSKKVKRRVEYGMMCVMRLKNSKVTKIEATIITKSSYHFCFIIITIIIIIIIIIIIMFGCCESRFVTSIFNIE